MSVCGREEALRTTCAIARTYGHFHWANLESLRNLKSWVCLLSDSHIHSHTDSSSLQQVFVLMRPKSAAK